MSPTTGHNPRRVDVLPRDVVAATDALVEAINGSTGPFASAVAELSGSSTDDAGLAALIDSTPAGPSWRLLIAVILRGLARGAPELKDRETSIAAWKQLDAALGPSCYGELKIDRNQQTYLVSQQLAERVLQWEERTEAAADLADDLTLLNSARGTLMRHLRAPLGEWLARPFISHALLDSKLDSLFRTASQYLEASPRDALVAHSRCIEGLDDYDAIAGEWETRYSETIALGSARSIRRVVDRHFHRSTASSPALLDAAGREKRYPLHVEGLSFDVGVTISNRGDGLPDDVVLAIDDTTQNIEVSTPHLYVGRLDQKEWAVRIPCRVVKAESEALITGHVRWTNVDSSVGRSDFVLVCEGQRTDLDFDSLANEEPFSLEPVTSADELVGRGDLLQQLVGLTRKKALGSSILYGQKRVGKTSLAQALASRINSDDGDLRAIYLEAGDYRTPDPSETVSNLGRKLCNEIRSLHPALAFLEVPPFGGSLVPLADFISQAKKLSADLRLLFILDEFDELPIDLYKRSEIADAFFLTLRSLSAKADQGFILVGGEKMEYILSSQGDALNKFQLVRVDYFDREDHWADFADLVRGPVADWLEVTDGAIERLYSETAGNPYFTKQICAELFRMMIRRRDSYVTEDDVGDAVGSARRTVGTNSFQHFWEDGIVDAGPIVEDVSIRRRKVLLAIARLMQLHGPAPVDEVAVMAEAEKLGVSRDQSLAELRSYERRRILNRDGTSHSFHVHFFRDWLIDKGASELLTTFLDWPEVQRLRDEQEQLLVKSAEIVEMVERWGLYRGARISEDRVRAWLDQFDEPRERRLMFQLLAGIEYYGADRIRQRLRDGHQSVRRGLSYVLDDGRRKRDEILVSYLDAPGKSGASYAKLYADENGIYYKNVIEPSEISERLAEDHAYHALVFVDDFVGSGDSVSEGLEASVLPHASTYSSLKGGLYVLAVAGFLSGKARVERAIEKLGLRATLRVLDPLDDSSRCFSSTSTAFPDEAERDQARRIASSYGRRLVKAAPLGYSGGEALVVFEQTVPNNCPAILWAKSGSWMPLFPRQ
ncbi:MAG: hypothetical protein M3406_16215 [Chloroflexota bacterium]|nr:hypothetical protein [Chloroflexota bacterium]